MFPDPREAGPDGLVAVGGTIDVDTLIAAYSSGIFPWPQPDAPNLWFSPDPRGVLFFKDTHWSRSFEKWRKKTDYTITINTDFESVIRACSKVPRPKQSGTWITEEMVQGYIDFHHAGYAHSLECRDSSGALIGGLYGVFVRGVFAGESMFYLRDNASKFCLWWLCQQLSEQGIEWMDTQMVTPLLAEIGARDVNRDQFLDLLLQTQKTGAKRKLVLKPYRSDLNR